MAIEVGVGLGLERSGRENTVIRCLAALAFALSLLSGPPSPRPPSPGPPAGTALAADISGDPNKPRRHFRERSPASLDKQRATEIYEALKDDLAAGYAKSGQAAAIAYPGWRRVSSAPYRSMTHGNIYIHNYVNETGAAYAGFEKAGVLPAGTAIAKPSFIVTEDGAVRPGPLFLMEKMPAGFKYVTGDWRYSMIMADGTLFGETQGEDAERVEYCIGCHLAVEHQDHLFFVPEDYRAAD